MSKNNQLCRNEILKPCELSGNGNDNESYYSNVLHNKNSNYSIIPKHEFKNYSKIYTTCRKHICPPSITKLKHPVNNTTINNNINNFNNNYLNNNNLNNNNNLDKYYLPIINTCKI